MNLTQIFDQERQRIATKLDINKEILYLTQAECIANGPNLTETLEISEKALIAHGQGEYDMPAKIGLHPLSDVFYHAMPSYLPSALACGIKWGACYPRNPKQYNIPQTSALFILNDLATGYPISIMDATWITAARTPAVTALAAAKLHPDAETFGMFGCGVQGMGHVRLIPHTLKKLKKIYVYDENPAAMDNLIATLQPELDIEIVKGSSAEQVTKSCEVLTSATIILFENKSNVKAEWISKGQTIFACDLNTFWDEKIQYNADKFIVDSIEEHELFANLGYYPNGLPTIYTETGKIIANLAKGREHKDEIIFSSNIGMSVLDVPMAKFIFDKALANNVGIKLPL